MANDNVKKINQVLWIILFANLAVALMKISIGNIINSTSITADGFHSITDASSNIIALIGMHFASKPVDEDHPYGHGKFETLAGLVIAGMLFMVGGKILLRSFERFNNPILPDINLDSILVLLITLGINIFVCLFEYRKGKELNSQILVSDSMHTKSDIYVSLGVLVTLISIKLGLPPVIDAITSLIVAIFILHAGYEIFKANSDVLVDKAVIDIEKVKMITESFKQVKDAHNIRSRGSENEVFIDMHIKIDPQLNVIETHELIHSIQEKLNEEIKGKVQVIAHIEPFREIQS